MSSFGSKLAYLVHQRSFQVALGLWIAISVAAVVLCHGTIQLPIGPYPHKPVAMVISSRIAPFFLGGNQGRWADTRGAMQVRIS